VKGICVRLVCVLGVCVVAACGKGSNAATVAASPSAAVVRDAQVDAVSAVSEAPEDPLVTDLWTRAAEGDADDLARLEDAVGSDALVEESPVGARRMIALQALAYSEDLTPLPFLANVATSGTDAEAAAALESAASIAAEPRRARDPDDALEAHAGGELLLALAKDATRPVARRALAVRVLRLLEGRSGVPAGEVPTGLDAH
jgi:hypothetical protein